VWEVDRVDVDMNVGVDNSWNRDDDSGISDDGATPTVGIDKDEEERRIFHSPALPTRSIVMGFWWIGWVVFSLGSLEGGFRSRCSISLE
jgi:hypothetical protein